MEESWTGLKGGGGGVLFWAQMEEAPTKSHVSSSAPPGCVWHQDGTGIERSVPTALIEIGRSRAQIGSWEVHFLDLAAGHEHDRQYSRSPK